MADTMEYGLHFSGDSRSVNLVMQDNVGSEDGAFVIKKVLNTDELMEAGIGSLISRVLASGELLKVSVACLVAMTPEVAYDFQIVGSEGESQCLATLAGPGTVWLQSTSYKA